jgi:hypothetical protein
MYDTRPGAAAAPSEQGQGCAGETYRPAGAEPTGQSSGLGLGALGTRTFWGLPIARTRLVRSSQPETSTLLILRADRSARYTHGRGRLWWSTTT